MKLTIYFTFLLSSFFGFSQNKFIFKENGFKVDGNTVFFSEQKVRQAIESAPARFRVAARNPANTVTIGGAGVTLAPWYGAAFIITLDGEQRKATMADYDVFCKLVQTSQTIGITGFLMAAPVPYSMFSGVIGCAVISSRLGNTIARP